MDALELLKQDHDEVKGLFKQIEEMDDSQQTRKLFERIKHELEVHEELEETLLYPELKKEEKLKDITLESYQEHHVMDVLLKEISGLADGSEAFKPKVKVLQENTEHHIEEEETQMFPRVRQVWDAARLQEVGQKMLDLKQKRNRSR